MELALKIFAITAAGLLGFGSISFMGNSKKIYKDYAKKYKKPKSKLKRKLTEPNETVRKIHVFLGPILILLSVFSIVYILTNW